MDNNKNLKAAPTAVTNGNPNSSGKKKKKKNVRASISLTADDAKTRAIVKQELRGLRVMHKDIPQLSAALAMPKDYLVPRFGGSVGSDPTAVANPWARIDVNFPDATVLKPDEFNGDWCPTYVFRDALRFCITPFSLDPSGLNPSIYTGNFTIRPAQGVEIYPRLYRVGWLSGPLVHGDTLYPGRLGPSDQHRGLLLSQGNVLKVNMSTAALNHGSYYILVVKRLSAGQWVPFEEYQDLPGTPGSHTIVITKTGYYAFTYTYYQGGALFTLPSQPGNFQIEMGVPGSMYTTWSQLALPHFSSAFSFVDAVRLTGVSLMYTNTASPLNHQGQIVGLQVPKGTSWLQYTSFSDVSEDKKSVTRDIVEGCYGFLKPTSEDDFKMCIYEVPGDTTIGTDEDIVFSLYPDSDYLAVIASVNVTAGQTGYLTVAASLEYTTLNQWISVKQGQLSDVELKESLEVFSRIPQWHTNALHWDDIWDWVKSTAKDVWNGIKEIAPLAAAAAPLLL